MGKYKGFAGSGMNANKNMSNVIKQAQKVQAEMEKVQEELEDKVVEGYSWRSVQLQLPLTARKKFFHLKSVLTLLTLKILKHLRTLLWSQSTMQSKRLTI